MMIGSVKFSNSKRYVSSPYQKLIMYMCQYDGLLMVKTNEYMTSQLCCLCYKQIQLLKSKDIHRIKGICQCSLDGGCRLTLDRDWNDILNIHNIIMHYAKFEIRIDEFKVKSTDNSPKQKEECSSLSDVHSLVTKMTSQR